MNSIRFTSKEAFIEALEGRRKFWRDYDRKQAREHKAAEQKWLTQTRQALRDAVKYDYDAMKKAVSYRGKLGNLDSAPSCPNLMEPKIDRVLAALQYTQSKAFVVDSNGVWSTAHDLLTSDPDAATTVC